MNKLGLTPRHKYYKAMGSTLLASLVAGLLLLAPAGCRTAGKESSTPVPTPSPRQVLEQAAAHLAALESVRFELEHETDTTPLMPGIDLRSLQGRAALPDRVAITIDAVAASLGVTIAIDVIVVGDEAYMTDPLTQAWRRVPQDSLPLNLLDLGHTLASIITAVENPRPMESEGRGDALTRRLTGSISTSELRSLLPGAAPGATVGLELAFDVSAYRLVEARIEGQALPDDKTTVVRILRLHSFDEPVDISLPEVAP